VRLDDVRATLVHRAQEPIRFTVERSPEPELLFTRYAPEVHPGFAFILSIPQMTGVAGHAAVLTNRSSRRITALVARWTATDSAGGVRTKHVIKDDYLPPRQFDWLVPGAQVLATLTGFHQALSGPHIAWVGSFGPSLDDDAAAITVALDSVVFEDGRLIGADEYDIARYIHRRHAAALGFVRQVDEAGTAAKDVDAALTAIANASRDSKERRSWYLQWALQARRSRPWLETLRTLPEPPQFRR
jgi:hypothetical protein